MKIEATIISTLPVAVAAIRLPNGICENFAVRPSDAAKRWASSMSKPTRTPFRTAANGRPLPDTPTTSSPRGLGTVTSGIGESCALNQRSAMPSYTPFCLISARNLLNASLSVVSPLRNPAPIGYEISGSPRTPNSGVGAHPLRQRFGVGQRRVHLAGHDRRAPGPSRTRIAGSSQSGSSSWPGCRAPSRAARRSACPSDLPSRTALLGLGALAPRRPALTRRLILAAAGTHNRRREEYRGSPSPIMESHRSALSSDSSSSVRRRELDFRPISHSLET